MLKGLKVINKYRNGNCKVSLYEDGTKIRETEDAEFKPEFPENIDIKVTDYCDRGCAYCHEGSTKKGSHGKLEQPFLESLREGTELAIGGGNPLDHPEIERFIGRMSERDIVCNMTVNQKHFLARKDELKNMVAKGVLKGIGVSFEEYTAEFVKAVKEFDNIVIHIINGVVNVKDLEKMYGEGLKTLILGYKVLRRGERHYSDDVEAKKKQVYDNIHNIIRGFKVVSMDNLAIEQLKARRLFTTEEWEEFYMGDDGTFTMYIDMVKEEYAMSSTTKERHKLENDIVGMFNTIKQPNTQNSN